MVRYILFILLLILPTIASAEAKEKKVIKPLLRDGFTIMGIDGKVSACGDKWFFEIYRDISDGRSVLNAGTQIEMLKSAGLEKMLAQITEKSSSSFRLYNAMITTYRDRNFIYCDYFVPLAAETTDTQVKTPQANEHKTEIKINEPNDTVMIPQEIIDRLRTRRIVRPENIKRSLELKQDSILTGRGGFIKASSDKLLFVFDSIGRNTPKVSLELLPCQCLARAQRKQAKEPEKILFKVSGIVTKHKGKYYLLLQRVTPTYNYGNFGR